MDYKSYGSKEWIEYRGYCNSRAIVYDYTGVPQWENNEEFWRKLGIEEDTVDMLRMDQIGFLDDIGEKELTLIAEYAKDGKAFSIASKHAVILVIRRLTKSSYRLFLVPFLFLLRLPYILNFITNAIMKSRT